jgi:hypothetical protein
MLPSELMLHLLCHPATPAPVVRTIEVHAARTADGGLQLAIACVATWPAC